MVRTELFNYHNVYDIYEFGDKNQHYYVYSFPYYKNVYSGRHLYPDGASLYLISSERYIELVTMKRKNHEVCQQYVEENIDSKLLVGSYVDGFEYLCDKLDYMGSLPSIVMQAVCDYDNSNTVDI